MGASVDRAAEPAQGKQHILAAPMICRSVKLELEN